MARSRVIVGAMSGTSADGVDAAVVRVHGSGLGMKCELLARGEVRFAAKLRERIVAMRATGCCTLEELAWLGRELGEAYARATQQALVSARIPAEEVTCIGAHGQTLFHAPPLTIQWFDPALLAARAGCKVVSDFRRADCALGGEGAPLVPFADYILFRDRRRGRVLLNIGGIANITWLPAGGELKDVVAFDTGPGNCLSDAIAAGELDRPFDRGGRVAARGTPDERIVKRFLDDGYLARPYPKSTDGPAMARAFARAMGRRKLSVPDQLATACLCTARAVARAIAMLPGRADELVAAGGGMHNRVMRQMLEQETGLPLRTTEELGVPIAAREAMAFALLAAATLDGVPASLPSVTGASRAAVLGAITPPP